MAQAIFSPKNLYWMAILLLAVLYAFGFHYISPDVVFIPLFANAMIAVLLYSGLNRENMRLELCFLYLLFAAIILVPAVGYLLDRIEALLNPLDMGMAIVLTLASLEANKRAADAMAIADILALAVLFWLTDAITPFGILLVFLLLMVHLAIRTKLFSEKEKQRSALLVFCIPLSCICLVYFVPSLAGSVAVAYVALSNIVTKTS